MTKDERILYDLTDHLQTKFERNVSDFISLCEIADLDNEKYSASIMALLMRLTAAYAVIHYTISAADFARAMGRQFELIREHHVEDSK